MLPTPDTILTPVPATLATCGLPTALSVIVTVPVTGPRTVGVKNTFMWQVNPAPRDGEQLSVSVNGAVTTMLEIVIAASPWFVTVMICGMEEVVLRN